MYTSQIASAPGRRLIPRHMRSRLLISRTLDSGAGGSISGHQLRSQDSGSTISRLRANMLSSRGRNLIAGAQLTMMLHALITCILSAPPRAAPWRGTATTFLLGLLCCFYGLGALSSPLVATQFSQLRLWTLHYLVSLGPATVNVALLSFVFRFRT